MKHIYETVWGLWPTVRAMAAETGASYEALLKCRKRGNIPRAALHASIFAKAAAAGVDLSAAQLLAYAAQRKAERKADRAK